MLIQTDREGYVADIPGATDILVLHVEGFRETPFGGEQGGGSVGFSSAYFLAPSLTFEGDHRLTVGLWEGFLRPEFAFTYGTRSFPQARTLERLMAVVDIVAERSEVYKQRVPSPRTEGSYHSLLWRFRPMEQMPQHLVRYNDHVTHRIEVGVPYIIPGQEAHISLVESKRPLAKGVDIGFRQKSGFKVSFHYGLESPVPAIHLYGDLLDIARFNELSARVFHNGEMGAEFIENSGLANI